MNVRPLGDRVAIKPHRDEETQRNGIIMLVGNQARLPARGEVMAVGPGRLYETGELQGERVPMRLKVGDQVLFPRGQGYPCEVNDEACIIMFDGEILAIYEGDPKNVPTTKLLDPRDDD